MELENIKGIGTKTIESLNKINIIDSKSLVEYYPYRYNIYNPMDINQIYDENMSLTINGIVETTPKMRYIKRNLNYLSFRVISSKKLINVIIYNRNFLSKYINVGKEISLFGKYNIKKNTFTASNIKLEPIEDKLIEPIYHTINNIKNKTLNSLIISALNDEAIENTLPDYIMNRYNFLNEYDALKEIHNPSNIDLLKKSKLVLIYKELFEFMLKINFLKIKRETNVINKSKIFDEDLIKNKIESLPFKLTSDQQKALDDILKDFKSKKRTNRLIVGDVGSGKTIVAFLAIYANFLSKYQSALLAPTEILAVQHYNNIIKEFPEIKVALLTSNIKKTDRVKILNDLKDNKINCIIGTHSIINEAVEFNNLGLVITDEQHRFGVKQRENLQNKGEAVDVIYLSATPIPRTYALTIFGDMDITEIKTKPSGRKSVKTSLFKENEIKKSLEIMLNEIKKGHQIYVVAPLVEDVNETNMYDVKKLATKLSEAFNDKVPISIIHGKQKSKEREAIIDKFKNNEIKILVSTTVIEVGVDVKNATCIVIFNAERFGLSTLHQLRGRVGRNDLDSYCILISNYDTERLKILLESSDGFYISEKDFELRGSGNLFGTKQSGEMDFKIADIKRDIKILQQANKDSKEFLNLNMKDKFKKYDYYKKVIESINLTD